MTSQEELPEDSPSFKLFPEEDYCESLYEVFLSFCRKDLGPVDEEWYLKKQDLTASQPSQRSLCSSPSPVNSPCSVSNRTVRNLISSPYLTASATAKPGIWSPSMPAFDASPGQNLPVFRTPTAVSTPRYLSRSLGAQYTGPDMIWSPSLETPPVFRHKQDLGNTEQKGLNPRSLFVQKGQEDPKSNDTLTEVGNNVSANLTSFVSLNINTTSETTGIEANISEEEICPEKNEPEIEDVFDNVIFAIPIEQDKKTEQESETDISKCDQDSNKTSLQKVNEFHETFSDDKIQNLVEKQDTVRKTTEDINTTQSFLETRQQSMVCENKLFDNQTEAKQDGIEDKHEVIVENISEKDPGYDTCEKSLLTTRKNVDGRKSACSAKNKEVADNLSVTQYFPDTLSPSTAEMFCQLAETSEEHSGHCGEMNPPASRETSETSKTPKKIKLEVRSTKLFADQDFMMDEYSDKAEPSFEQKAGKDLFKSSKRKSEEPESEDIPKRKCAENSSVTRPTISIERTLHQQAKQSPSNEKETIMENTDIIRKPKHEVSETQMLELEICSSYNNDFSLTQIMEAAESTYACMRSLDYGLTQFDEVDVNNSGPEERLSQGILDSHKFSTDDKALNPFRTESDDNSSLPLQVRTDFSTGGGRSISVARKALNSARSLFDEESTDNQESKDVPSNSSFKGLQINDTIPKEVKKSILKSGETSDNVRCSLTVEQEIQKSVITGFSTACGKQVFVSTDALMSAKSLLADTKDSISEEDQKTSAEVCSLVANGKAVSVSKNVQKPSLVSFCEGISEKVPANDETTSSDSSLNIVKKGNLNDFQVSKSKAEPSKVVECFENSLKSLRVPTGFRTASGRNVSINKETLNKAKSFLNEEVTTTTNSDFGSYITNTTCVIPLKNCDSFKVPTMFTTGSGKAVSVSNSALTSAKSLLQEEDLDFTSINFTRDKTFLKFPTANNKAISVSKDKESLSKEDYQTTVFTGFTTRSGKTVSVFKKGLSAEQTLLNEDASHTSNSLTGFSTASGKVISVSETALATAKSFLEDGDKNSSALTTEQVVPVLRSLTELTSNDVSSFSKIPTGFTTASGKSVSVSKEALLSAKSILTEGCDEISVTTGFTAASGRAISVSKSALQSAKTLLASDTSDSSKILTGFSTAAGKTVSVSKDALLSAKSLLDEGNGSETLTSYLNRKLAPELTENMLPKNISSKVPTGFSTASGKAVVISKEALNSAKSLLNDGSNNSVTTEFSTANGKSAWALSKTLKSTELFSGENYSSNISTGFTTASGKSVSISKKSLCAARSLFEQTNSDTSLKLEFSDKEYLISDRKMAEDVASRICEGISKGEVFHSSSSLVSTSEQQRTASSVKNSSPVKEVSNHSGPSFHQDQGFEMVKVKDLKSNTVLVCKSEPFISEKEVGKEGKVVASDQQNRVSSLDNLNMEKEKYVSPLELEELRRQKNQRKSATFRKREALFHYETNLGAGDKSKQIVRIGSGKPKFSTPFRKHSVCRLPSKGDSVVHVSDVKENNDTSGAACKSEIQPGKLWTLRKQSRLKRIPLKQATGGKAPSSYSLEQLLAKGVNQSTANIKCSNAADFCFSFSKAGINDLECGLSFQLNSQRQVGKEEFYELFGKLTGVDVSLISKEWVFNHYKWIVWKLAAMEVSFPDVFAGRCLTPDEVICQLKYRYDIEIDNSRRSAIKKIVERDDVPSKPMVLCVSTIDKYKEGVIELTDGWYSLKTAIDKALVKQVENGKIPVGQKLLISGAELIGPPEACTPFEIPPDLMLKIYYNSTRRAVWHARLGYFYPTQPFPVSLRSLDPEGGCVGRIDCVVMRAYPLQYLEKLPNGKSIVRREKEEVQAAQQYEQLRSQYLEKLTSEILSQEERAQIAGTKILNNANRGIKSRQQVLSLRTGKEIYEALLQAPDPSYIEENLTEEQQSMLQDYQCTMCSEKQVVIREKLKQSLATAVESGKCLPERVVVPFFKVLIGGLLEYDIQQNTSCLLSIWRPPEELKQVLVDGCTFSIYNLGVGPNRFEVPDVMNCRVHLTSLKNTRYEPLVYNANIRLPFQGKVMAFEELNNRTSLTRSFDVVGLIFHTSQQQSADVLYLTDANLNILQVIVYGGLASSGGETVIQTGQIIAATDLILRTKKQDLTNINTASTTDLSDLTSNPKNGLLSEALVHLVEKITSISDKIAAAQQVLKTKLKPQVFTPPCPVPRPAFRPYPVYSPKNVSPALPLLPKQSIVNTAPKLSDGLVLPKMNVVVPGSPAERLSFQVKARISLLEKYGALAPLPPIPVKSSPRIKKPFNAPKVEDNVPSKSEIPDSESPPLEFNSQE